MIRESGYGEFARATFSAAPVGGASGDGFSIRKAGLPGSGGFDPNRVENVYSSLRVWPEGTKKMLRTFKNAVPVSVLPLSTHDGVDEFVAKTPAKLKLSVRGLLRSRVAS